MIKARGLYYGRSVKLLNGDREMHSRVEKNESLYFSCNEKEIDKLHYEALLANNPDGVMLVDFHGQLMKVNDAVEEITGYFPIELAEMTLLEIVVSEDHNRAAEAFQQAVAGEPSILKCKIQHKLGKIGILSVKFIPTSLESLFIVLKDYTEQERERQQREESDRLYRLISENTKDLITILDCNFQMNYVSPSFRHVYGIEEVKLVGQSFLSIVPLGEQEDLICSLQSLLVAGDSFHKECRLILSKETNEWFDIQFSSKCNELTGKVEQIIIVAREITARKSYEDKLKQMAYYDHLTNLPNKRFFLKRLKKALNRNKNGMSKLGALLYLDCDDFKLINDQFGHDEGDKALIRFSEILKSVVREGDTVARVGGDEFLILLESLNSVEDAIIVAERILDIIKENRGGETPSLSTSIGISLFPDHGLRFKTLIKRADEAMYQAKSMGKNGYKIYL